MAWCTVSIVRCRAQWGGSDHMRSTVIQNQEGQGRAKPGGARRVSPKKEKKNNSRALQSFEKIWFARFDSTCVFPDAISRHVNGKTRIACLVNIYIGCSPLVCVFVTEIKCIPYFERALFICLMPLALVYPGSGSFCFFSLFYFSVF